MGKKDETWKGVGREMIVKLFMCFLQGKSAGSAIGTGKIVAILCSLFLSPCNALFPPHTIQSIHCSINNPEISAFSVKVLIQVILLSH